MSLLRSWAVEHSDIEIEIAPGDWRRRFDRALPKQDGLVFISFDPYMFNRHRHKENPGNMYPAYLDRLVDATRSFPENVLLQLSTYDTNDDNGQNAVAECIRSGLESGGFEEIAILKPSAKMMSLLYQRRVDFSAELTSLPCRFQTWFDAIERRPAGLTAPATVSTIREVIEQRFRDIRSGIDPLCKNPLELPSTAS